VAEEVLKRCSLNGAWVQPSHGAIIQYAARMGTGALFQRASGDRSEPFFEPGDSRRAQRTLPERCSIFGSLTG
jgi:hypothetical protein